MVKYLRPVLLAGVALGTVQSPAFAQSEGDAAQTNDIIVTARRVEERLQDVPISITVFNQDQLTDRNVIGAQDLAAFTPSLSVNSTFGSDNSTFALRGFGQDGGTPPSVGVYFADVVAPRATADAGVATGDGAGPGMFFDLQNVQVLKGPQGTLFGRNTTGGAVLLVPRKPTSRFEGYVEGSIGNYNLRRVQAVVNIPLAETFRVRIGVDRNKREGFLKNISGIGPKDFADIDYTAVRASVVADLTPDLENYLIATYLKSDNNSTIQKIVDCDPSGPFGAFACSQIAKENAAGGFFTIQNGVANPRSRLDQWQVINTTTWAASDTLTIKNIISYAELRSNLRTPFSGAFWPVGPVPSELINFSVINAPPGLDNVRQSTFTEEFQIQGGSGDGKLTYQAGAYLEVSNPLGPQGILANTLLACTDGVAADFQCTDLLGIQASQATGSVINFGSVGDTRVNTRFRNMGTYAQGSYSFTDQLKATAGFRYTWDRQQSRTQRTSYIFPVTPPFDRPPSSSCFDAASAPSCIYGATAKSGKPTWLLGLDYMPNDAILLYAKYTRGYRAGGVFPNAPINYRVFSPEKLDAYEAGLKSTFTGAVAGHFNIAGFYNDLSNQQIQVGFNPAPGRAAQPTTALINAGQSRIYGVEIEGSISPFAGFTLDGSYTYLHTEILKILPLESVDPNYIVAASILPGDPLLLSPKHKFTVSGTYTLPLNENVGQISVNANYSYIGPQLTNYDFRSPAVVAAYGKNWARLDSRGLLNLNLAWRSIAGSPVDLSVFASNVTNKKYYYLFPATTALGYVTSTLGEPRMYGLRIRYNFGD